MNCYTRLENVAFNVVIMCVCVSESMEFSLDADSPINTPVLPCTPEFYHSHCQQVNHNSYGGQQCFE